MTGQNEISILCKKLRRKFPYLTRNQYKDKQILDKEKTISEVEEVRESLTAKEGKFAMQIFFQYFIQST